MFLLAQAHSGSRDKGLLNGCVSVFSNGLLLGKFPLPFI